MNAAISSKTVISTAECWVETVPKGSHRDKRLSAEIAALPLREDAVAVEIKASLFTLGIRAALISTDG